MHELEDVEPVGGAEPFDEAHELRRVEPELALLAPRLRPPPRSLGGELDAHAGRRLDAQLFGGLQEDVEFAQLLDDDEDLVPEFLPH